MTMYNEFQPIVDLLLNNWTALQLAVEHGMGSPGGEKTAQQMSVYVARYCLENVTNVEDVTDLLEDLMDEEFETTCQDNSPKEIATLLLYFLSMLKEGKQDEIKTQLEAMPKYQKWLSQPINKTLSSQGHGNPNDDSTSSSEDDDIEHTSGNGLHNGHHFSAEPATSNNNLPEPMDEDDEDVDPGWTVVRTRKKK